MKNTNEDPKMFVLKLEIEYNYPEPKKDAKDENGNPIERATNIEVTRNYISWAVNNKYNNMLHGQLLRTWGRLHTKIENAVDVGKKEIKITEDERDFIKKVFVDETKFPANDARYVMILQDEIDKL